MTKKLDLEHITKIEGHAKLYVKVADGKVENVELRVLEGARYFEGILKERKYNDVSHIASRICGICSVVHTITAIKAVENAFGVEVTEQTRRLREVLNIGGMIQSHALHLYFLTLPDYLGVDGAIDMTKSYRTLIDRALRLKRLGNNLVSTLAGRDVHPIACVIGGFSTLPAKEQVAALLSELQDRKEDAVETVKMFLNLKYPEFKKPAPHFALTGKSYFYSDTIVQCEGGTCFPIKDYDEHFKQFFREGSTAEFATKEGKSYFVGALARVCNNYELLSSEAKQLGKPIVANKDNPFMNIPAQALEMLEGINRSIVLLSDLDLSQESCVENCVKPCACEGVAACEAPRGILFHKYKFDEDGFCTYADITTPTTQNLQHLEEAIKELVDMILDKSPDDIKLEIEKLIRAYDPCISCSTHFLQLEWEAE